MRSPEEIADSARSSISDYCMNECKAFCCSKGYLVLSKKEMILTIGDKQGELEDTGFLTPMENDEYALNLGNPGSCPSLNKSNSACVIHKNPGRNLACKKFPIFIEDKKVRFSDRCPAVKANKFYPYIKEFIALGFKIE